jgi:hypothetical protein
MAIARGTLWTAMKFVLTMIAILVCSEAPADIQTKVRGAGQASCGDWTRARRTGGTVDAVYVNWIDGYVTGFSVGIAHARSLEYYDVTRTEPGHVPRPRAS